MGREGARGILRHSSMPSIAGISQSDTITRCERPATTPGVPRRCPRGDLVPLAVRIAVGSVGDASSSATESASFLRQQDALLAKYSVTSWRQDCRSNVSARCFDLTGARGVSTCRAARRAARADGGGGPRGRHGQLRDVVARATGDGVASAARRSAPAAERVYNGLHGLLAPVRATVCGTPRGHGGELASQRAAELSVPRCSTNATARVP